MKKQLLLASALSLWLGASQTALAADASADVLNQLEVLTKKVQQLEAELNAVKKSKKTAVAAKPATNQLSDQELQQKVKVIERKLELADEEAAKKKKETPVVSLGEKGFSVKSADGDYEVKFRALIQEDFRFYREGIKGIPPAPPALASTATDNYLTRRARPTIEGTFAKIYDFKLTADFGNGQSRLVDSYLDARFDPRAKLKVGKFTPPLGIERLQSSADVRFNELALTSNFIPSRDTGAQIHGDLFNSTVNYAVGTFNGVIDGGDGDNDATNDKDVEARIFVQPFANTPGFFQGLGFGVATSHDNLTGSTTNTELPTYKTPGQENFFTYRTNSSATNTVIANGDHDRVIPQFSFYNGPFGLTGEYAKVKQAVTSINGATVRDDTLDNKAWQLTASFLLTGEDESSKGVTPREKFDLATGGWGAWELIARTHQLEIDKGAFEVNGVLPSSVSNSFADPRRSAQKASAVGVGVNWYPNKNLKFGLDYDHTTFNWGGGGTTTAPQDRDNEDVIILRTQVSF